jgi:dynein heavy chain, axonemal
MHYTSLQNFARKMKYPIDTVSFSFQMMEETLDQIDSRPEDGCYVYGLFLEGARWDGVDKGLIEPKPKVRYYYLYI